MCVSAEEGRFQSKNKSGRLERSMHLVTFDLCSCGSRNIKCGSSNSSSSSNTPSSSNSSIKQSAKSKKK